MSPRKPKASETTERKTKRLPQHWVKGQSGNPAGRPKGSRHKLEADFISALVEAFEEGGAAAIKQVMAKDPTAFLNVIAKVLPKQVEKDVNVRGNIDVNHTSEPVSETADWIAGVLGTGAHSAPPKPLPN